MEKNSLGCIIVVLWRRVIYWLISGDYLSSTKINRYQLLHELIRFILLLFCSFLCKCECFESPKNRKKFAFAKKTKTQWLIFFLCLQAAFKTSLSIHLKKSTTWLIYQNPVLRKLVKRLPNNLFWKITFVCLVSAIRIIIIRSVVDIFSMSYVCSSMRALIIKTDRLIGGLIRNKLIEFEMNRSFN